MLVYQRVSWWGYHAPMNPPGTEDGFAGRRRTPTLSGSFQQLGNWAMRQTWWWLWEGNELCTVYCIVLFSHVQNSPPTKLAFLRVDRKPRMGFVCPWKWGSCLKTLITFNPLLLFGTPFSLKTCWSNRWPSHEDESKLHLVLQSTDAPAHLTDQ